MFIEGDWIHLDYVYQHVKSKSVGDTKETSSIPMLVDNFFPIGNGLLDVVPGVGYQSTAIPPPPPIPPDFVHLVGGGL